MQSTLAIIAAIFRKDYLSVLPLVALTAAIQILDVLVTKLEVMPALAPFMPYVVLLASFALILAVFQLDAPASLVDDWLCRPVPRRALFTAKLLLVMVTLYGMRAVATFAVDLYLGYGLIESLQEALLLQNIFAMLVLPALMMIAVTTTTLVQGMGALLGLFVLIFVIPSPLIDAPGPLQPAIGDALSTNGMGWLATVPAKLTLLLFTAGCLLAVYRYRNILLGRILLFAGVTSAVLLILLPMWLVPWTPVFGLQRMVSGSAEEQAPAAMKHFSLLAEGACFPAAAMDALDSDANYAMARQVLGVNPWSADQLKVAGPGGISFITRVTPRGLPRRWRAKTLYVQASFLDAAGQRVSLRPAQYVTETAEGAGSSAFVHQWLLPRAQLDSLTASVAPRLQLDYSMMILEPRSHELAPDGRRRRIPGLGWCGATLDRRNNRIEVDCFGAARRPALVSAELLGITASRVDASSADYGNAVMRTPTGRRYRIELSSPSLLAKPMVRVTAWRAAGTMQARVERQGLLGADLNTCPVPSAAGYNMLTQSNWSDKSSHTVSYLEVDAGVQLEVLDWGGAGKPLLLLPGLGATAHTFDSLAPKLARHHRVLAISRRGAGGSSRPEYGYDTATLARDVVRAIERLGLVKPVVVGSSVAGDEMTWLGARHAEHIAGLVYLDAAYDRTRRLPEDQPRPEELLPPRPAVLPEELVSYAAIQGWFARTSATAQPEGELIAAYNIANRYLAGSPAFDMRLLQAIEAEIGPPRYADVKVPALALYATVTSVEQRMRPWYDRNDPELLKALNAGFAIAVAGQRWSIEQFAGQIPDGEVVEYPGADHAIFLSHEGEVIEQIRRFVDRRAHPATSLPAR